MLVVVVYCGEKVPVILGNPALTYPLPLPWITRLVKLGNLKVSI